METYAVVWDGLRTIPSYVQALGSHTLASHDIGVGLMPEDHPAMPRPEHAKKGIKRLFEAKGHLTITYNATE